MLELKRIYWSRQVLRLAYAAAIVWLSVTVVLAFMPKTNGGARASGSSTAEIFPGIFDDLLAAVVAPGSCAVILAITAAIIIGRDVRRRDPVRRFTRQQRRVGMARAGGQCEMEAGFRCRCSRPAEHGDHFYPWSKGGSTSLQNFVAACARCNRAKSARIPSPGQQKRLERRRRVYVTLEDAVRVGERQPLG
jgi:hypothetical protein